MGLRKPNNANAQTRLRFPSLAYSLKISQKKVSDIFLESQIRNRICNPDERFAKRSREALTVVIIGCFECQLTSTFFHHFSDYSCHLPPNFNDGN